MRTIHSLFSALTGSAISLLFLGCGQPTDPGSGASGSAIAPASLEEPETPVTACGTTIVAPGRYRLVNDLLACPAVGIAIRSSRVRLLLNGHRIGGASASAAGIEAGSLPPSHRTLTRVWIEGSGTVEGFAVGVSFTNVSDSHVSGIRLRRNGTGLLLVADAVGPEWLTSNADTIVGNVVVDNTGNGLRAGGVQALVITDSRFEHNGFPNGGSGIDINSGGGILIRRDRIQGNAWSGVNFNELIYGKLIVGSVILNNGFRDISDWNGNTGCWMPGNHDENVFGSYECFLD